MKIELAPMEGITSYVYRNAFCKFYGGVDTYFSPFISTHKDKELNFKEIKEIKPDNNIGYKLVPQVLTADVNEFLYTSSKIAEYGYDHININFGCPSGTVTPKGKGSGILRDPVMLENLLDVIFSKTNMKISVKTRMGYEDPREWERLIHIYEKFPLEELIVHARVREDFYNGKARLEELANYVFPDCLKLSYNGDIFYPENLDRIKCLFPNIHACMIGRGLIADPSLASHIKKYESCDTKDLALLKAGLLEDIDIITFKAFNHELVDKYSEIMPGDKNTLFKVKELWIYWIKTFERSELKNSTNERFIFDFKALPDTPISKKLLKSVRKSNSLKDYLRIIDSL